MSSFWVFACVYHFFVMLPHRFLLQKFRMVSLDWIVSRFDFVLKNLCACVRVFVCVHPKNTNPYLFFCHLTNVDINNTSFYSSIFWIIRFFRMFDSLLTSLFYFTFCLFVFFFLYFIILVFVFVRLCSVCIWIYTLQSSHSIRINFHIYFSLRFVAVVVVFFFFLSVLLLRYCSVSGYWIRFVSKTGSRFYLRSVRSSSLTIINQSCRARAIK